MKPQKTAFNILTGTQICLRLVLSLSLALVSCSRATSPGSGTAHLSPAADDNSSKDDTITDPALIKSPLLTDSKTMAEEEEASKNANTEAFRKDIHNKNLSFMELANFYDSWSKQKLTMQINNLFFYGHPASKSKALIANFLNKTKFFMQESNTEGAAHLSRWQKQVVIDKAARRELFFEESRERDAANAAYNESRACVEYFSNTKVIFRDFINLYRISLSALSTPSEKALARWRLDTLAAFLHLFLKSFVQDMEGLWAPETSLWDMLLDPPENGVKLTAIHYNCIMDPSKRRLWAGKLFTVMLMEKKLHDLVFGIYGKEIPKSNSKKLARWAGIKESKDTRKAIAVFALSFAAASLIPWATLPALKMAIPGIVSMLTPTTVAGMTFGMLPATFYLYHVGFEFLDHKLNPDIERYESYQWEGTNLISPLKHERIHASDRFEFKLAAVVTKIKKMNKYPDEVKMGMQAYREIRKAKLNSPSLYSKILTPIYTQTIERQIAVTKSYETIRKWIEDDFGSVDTAIRAFDKRLLELREILVNHPDNPNN